MLNDINIEKILFLDIETVPQYPKYNDLPEKLKFLWDQKAQKIAKNNDETPKILYKKAGIYAEFGKIVCISLTYIRKKNGQKAMFVKSIYGHNEKSILTKLNKLLDGYYNTNQHFLCAHNGKEFDFPYIARRSLINSVKIAQILNTPGAKPWEIRHLDTLQLWRFGDYKSWTSLDLLTTIFNIPSPKNDIDGSMVADIYWNNNDIDRIANYCQQDTIAVAQLYLKYLNKNIIPENLIFFR